MAADPSRGRDAVAHGFIAARSEIGAGTVRSWAERLPAGAAVLDIGCGSGWPISAALADAGFHVFGIDASPTLAAEFRRRLPSAEIACEAVETSALFGRRFGGAVAIGLIFLLPRREQRRLVGRVARALHPGGRFLFTAPREPCEWNDTLTGRRSRSLGEPAYRRALERAGMRLAGCEFDEGRNHYYDAVRLPA